MSNATQRVRVLVEAHLQGGLCYWCTLPMLLDGDADHALFVTADHLVQKGHPGNSGGKRPMRPIVAAHRVCNTRRKHAPAIPDAVRAMVINAIEDYDRKQNARLAPGALT